MGSAGPAGIEGQVHRRGQHRRRAVQLEARVEERQGVDHTCPWCKKAQMGCVYGYGHYQYQCNACGAYGDAGDCETQAEAMVFAHIPGALGMLYDAHEWLGGLEQRYRDEFNRHWWRRLKLWLSGDDYESRMARIVAKMRAKMLAAIDAVDPRRKERLREIGVKVE